MSDPDELFARMAAADPAASLPPAGPDRVSRLLEDAMSHDELTESRDTGPRHRSPLTWVVAAAAVVLIAAAGVFALAGRGSSPTTPPVAGEEREPVVLALSVPEGAGAGRCMVPNAEVLGGASVAFDGEVVEVADSRVTLVPSDFYAGGPADEVTVDQASVSMQDLVGAVRFEEGQRYLVAADAGEVMVCGFSGAYDAQLADLYAEAFGG